jgi:hypothetical protein
MRRRLIEHLSAAIGAVNLIDTPEGGAKSAEFWKTRAIRHIMRAQHLYEAWNMLVSYKAGQHVKRLHPFRAGDLLEWLASETYQTYTPHADHDQLVMGNRETLQEALLLIHSAAYSLGPAVRLHTQFKDGSFRFHVRYRDAKQKAQTLGELIEQLATDWRTESAAYELDRAQDFLEMNDCKLTYERGDGFCDLVFALPAARKTHQQDAAAVKVNDDTQLAPPVNDADETHPSGEDIRRRFSKRVQAQAQNGKHSESSSK